MKKLTEEKRLEKETMCTVIDEIKGLSQKHYIIHDEISGRLEAVFNKRSNVMNTKPELTLKQKRELIEAAVQYAYDKLSLEYNTLGERMVCEEVEKALWLVLDFVGANDQQDDEGFDPYAADEKDWRDG